MATPKRERTPLPPSTTFAAAANRYIAEGGSERSLVAVMDHFGPKTTIGEIDEAAIAKAVRMIGPHMTESTAQTVIIKPITTVLNHAFDTGRRRGPGKAPPRWLTPDEAEQLIDAASHPQRIGLRDPGRETLRKIAFMLGTGPLPGEVITVDGSALQRATGLWHLPGIPSIVLPRTVLPPPRAAELIGDVPARGTAFVAPNGQPYVVRHKGGGQMAEAFGQVREAAGLDGSVTPAIRCSTAAWSVRRDS